MALFTCLFSATAVWAQKININEFTVPIAKQAGYDDVTATSLSQQIGNIIKAVMGLAGTIFLVLTIYAGFLWLTAAGNEEQAGKAAKILTTAVIGLVIAVSAYSITAVIMFMNFQPPGGVGGTDNSSAWWEFWN